MNGPPRPRSVRRYGFDGSVAALRELLGARVGVEVAPLPGAGPFVTVTGELAQVHAIGDEESGIAAFDVNGSTFRVFARTLVGAVREDYADSSGRLRWRLIAFELAFGVVIEVEEIPGAGQASRRHPGERT